MGRGDIDEDPFVYVSSGADEPAKSQRDIAHEAMRIGTLMLYADMTF